MIESRMPKENPLWPPPPPAVGWWADVMATIRETQTAVNSRIINVSRPPPRIALIAPVYCLGKYGGRADRKSCWVPHFEPNLCFA